MKTLILGIGNTILGDDGVGVHIVQQIASRIQDENIVFKDTAAAGLNLLDIILGFERMIVVDALLVENENIGNIFRFELANSNQPADSISIHSCGLSAAIELGKQLYQENMPARIMVFAVGIQAVQTVTEEMTPAVKAAIPKVVDEIIKELYPKIFCKNKVRKSGKDSSADGQRCTISTGTISG
jgi:hydrogenase maturation protease